LEQLFLVHWALAQLDQAAQSKENKKQLRLLFFD
jgi:hypothetical protein